ncbi:hypothetical protein GCM10027586_09960 [Kineococcus gypseus]
MSIVRGAYAAPHWANSQRVGDVGTKATLMLLAAYADEDFSCFPGQERIAEETEQSVRTVRRQLDVLEEVGLISREPRYVFSEASGKRVRTSDRFVLHLDVTATKADVKAAQERIAAGEQTKKTARSKATAGSEDLPVNLAGRYEVDLPANVTGRSDEDLPVNLAGRSERAPTGHSERTYRPNSTSTPVTSDRVTPRRTPKKINTYVTSTSARDVTSAADRGRGAGTPARDLVEVSPTDSSRDAVRSGGAVGTGADVGADVLVDVDEVERTVVQPQQLLHPTVGDAMRLGRLVEQRMRRGWTRQDILDVVESRLRPGALDNPCGLFAKTLIPLEEAPPRPHQAQLTLVKPWCGQCDERTRRVLDESGFPDFTVPPCIECEQLLFAQHMERGAS